MKGGSPLTISYKKLWKLLIDKNLKKKDLCELAGISSTSIAKLGRDETVNTIILIKICEALHCGCLDDICELVENDKGEILTDE